MPSPDRNFPVADRGSTGGEGKEGTVTAVEDGGDWDVCSRPGSRLTVSYLEVLFLLVVLAGEQGIWVRGVAMLERFMDMDVLITPLSETWIEDEDYIE